MEDFDPDLIEVDETLCLAEVFFTISDMREAVEEAECGHEIDPIKELFEPENAIDLVFEMVMLFSNTIELVEQFKDKFKEDEIVYAGMDKMVEIYHDALGDFYGVDCIHELLEENNYDELKEGGNLAPFNMTKYYGN